MSINSGLDGDSEQIASRWKTDFSDLCVALIGYARASPADQKLTLRDDAPMRTGCERNFDDQPSG